MVYRLKDNSLTTDELYHYGVLGMKWGIRRARKQGVEYTYRSHGQKKWEKKLTKRIAKGKKSESISKAKEKYDLYKQRDKNRQYYAERTNVGKRFANTILTGGPLGAGNYARYRASGDSKTAAFLKSNIIASTLGYPITLLLSRGAEMKTARNQIRDKR